MTKRYTVVLAFAFAFGAAPFAAFAQSPMPAMDMSSFDCSTATAKIISMMTPPSEAMADMKPSDDTDKTYAAAMKMMIVHGDMMSKIEMKCGKNAKTMATATKMNSELQDNWLIVNGLSSF
jgi:hypothetical protein